MKTLSVRLRTVTPLFLGGAQEKSCELRPPSIKGALRFWFRFIEGARQGGDLRKVREEEQRIFGSTDTGVGVFSITLNGNPPITSLAARPAAYREWPIEIGYMGYGPIALRQFDKRERDNRKAAKKPTTVFEPVREFIDSGCELRFKLNFRSRTVEEDEQRVYEALWLWTHLGGFGSRSRRGWGSLELLEPATREPIPIGARDNSDFLKKVPEAVEKLFETITLPSTAAFSHWFKDACIFVPHVAKDWQAAMEWIGDKFIRFRSNSTRFKFKSPSKGPKYPCWPDHDLVQDYLCPPGSGGVPTTAPMRAAFGLPHNYTFGGLKDRGWNPYQATVTARVIRGGQQQQIDRRASPLFVHLHGVDAGKVAVVVTFIPADFLPGTGGAEIRFDPEYDKRLPTRSYTPSTAYAAPPNYQAILDFLKSL